MLSLYSGIYLEPSRKETVWWDKNPILAGMDFSHTRKIKNLDIVLSANLFRDDAHREHEYHERARMGIRLRQKSEKLPGLAYGLNLTGMLTRTSDFLLWRDSRTGALRQNPQTVSELSGNRFNIDPFIEGVLMDGKT